MGGAVVGIWDVGACRVVCVRLWPVTVPVTGTVTESASVFVAPSGSVSVRLLRDKGTRAQQTPSPGVS